MREEIAIGSHSSAQRDAEFALFAVGDVRRCITDATIWPGTSESS